jgi:hypothetical protein
MLLYKKVKGEWDRSLSSQKSRELKLIKNGKNKKTTVKKTTTVTVSKPAVAMHAASDIVDSDSD